MSGEGTAGSSSSGLRPRKAQRGLPLHEDFLDDSFDLTPPDPPELVKVLQRAIHAWFDQDLDDKQDESEGLFVGHVEFLSSPIFEELRHAQHLSELKAANLVVQDDPDRNLRVPPEVVGRLRGSDPAHDPPPAISSSPLGSGFPSGAGTSSGGGGGGGGATASDRTELPPSDREAEVPAGEAAEAAAEATARAAAKGTVTCGGTSTATVAPVLTGEAAASSSTDAPDLAGSLAGVSLTQDDFLSPEAKERGPRTICCEGPVPRVEERAEARLPGLKRAMREPLLGLSGLPADLRVDYTSQQLQPRFAEMLGAVVRRETGVWCPAASLEEQADVLCDTLEFAPEESKATMVDDLLCTGDYLVETRYARPKRVPPLFLALTLPPFPSQAFVLKRLLGMGVDASLPFELHDTGAPVTAWDLAEGIQPNLLLDLSRGRQAEPMSEEE